MSTRADKKQENKSKSGQSGSLQKKKSGDGAFRMADNRPEIFAQKKLQAMANNSPQAKIATQLKAVSSGDVDGVVQRQIDIHYFGHQEDDGRASHVEATVSGATLEAGANNPSEDPVGWGELAENFIMDDVFRMHLWNGRLGGPGDKTWNLTPGLRDVNTSMADEEVNAQAEVNDGNMVDLWTDVAYGYTIDDEDPRYYYPNHISFNWRSQTDQGDHVDEGSWQSIVPLPDEADMDWDPDNPGDMGLDETYAW